MISLEPEVRVKLIEISKEWVEATTKAADGDTKRNLQVKHFGEVYKQLVKAISEEK